MSSHGSAFKKGTDAAAARSGKPDLGFPPLLEEEVRPGSCQRLQGGNGTLSVAVDITGHRRSGVSPRSVMSGQTKGGEVVTGGVHHSEGNLKMLSSR